MGESWAIEVTAFCVVLNSAKEQPQILRIRCASLRVTRAEAGSCFPRSQKRDLGQPGFCASTGRELGHRRRSPALRLNDSGLGNYCDGDFQSGDSDGEFRSLPCRRVLRKPFNPLFIHSGEVAFFKNNDGGAYDAIKGRPRCLEDGRYVPQTLPGLLLDCFAHDLSGYRVLRPRARDEH